MADPDIEVSSGVRADALRFHRPPRTRVRFDGSPGRRSASTGTRRNLPCRVADQVTYRDVRISHTVRSELREAVGSDSPSTETHTCEERDDDAPDGGAVH